MAIYIAFLTGFPVLETFHGLEEAFCCEATCEPAENKAHQSQKEKGCSDLCNPFLSCKCTFGFLTTLLEIDFYQKNSIPVLIPHQIRLVDSYFFPAIWDPPK